MRVPSLCSSDSSRPALWPINVGHGPGDIANFWLRWQHHLDHVLGGCRQRLTLSRELRRSPIPQSSAMDTQRLTRTISWGIDEAWEVGFSVLWGVGLNGQLKGETCPLDTARTVMW